jgi:hypothetical protein
MKEFPASSDSLEVSGYGAVAMQRMRKVCQIFPEVRANAPFPMNSEYSGLAGHKTRQT